MRTETYVFTFLWEGDGTVYQPTSQCCDWTCEDLWLRTCVLRKWQLLRIIALLLSSMTVSTFWHLMYKSSLNCYCVIANNSLVFSSTVCFCYCSNILYRKSSNRSPRTPLVQLSQTLGLYFGTDFYSRMYGNCCKLNSKMRDLLTK